MSIVAQSTKGPHPTIIFPLSSWKWWRSLSRRKVPFAAFVLQRLLFFVCYSGELCWSSSFFFFFLIYHSSRKGPELLLKMSLCHALFSPDQWSPHMRRLQQKSHFYPFLFGIILKKCDILPSCGRGCRNGYRTGGNGIIKDISLEKHYNVSLTSELYGCNIIFVEINVYKNVLL